jgi:Zn-dependent protease
MTFAFLLNISLIVVVLLFSMVLHEVAHGYVAWLNGDPTARLSGRITLNPIPHIDPINTVLLPLFLLIVKSPFIFGAARPVPVNPSYFRNYRVGEITTSLAGSATNLVLAVFFAYLLRLNLGGPGLELLAYYGFLFNVILAVFNLLPIPPLDGSHIVAVFLPYRWAQYYRALEPYCLVIIIGLYFTGLLWMIFRPIYRLIAAILQVPLVF